MKLIDKDVVFEKIKKRLKEHVEQFEKSNVISSGIKAEEDLDVISFLDTLEVKEIDLEDSIKETLAQKYIDYTFKRHNIDPESKEGQLIYYAYMHGMNQCLNQLKAQKGE